MRAKQKREIWKEREGDRELGIDVGNTRQIQAQREKTTRQTESEAS